MPDGTTPPADETQFYDPQAGAPTGEPSTLLEAGRRVGKCRIVGTLGRGGMGIVYRAHHETLDLPVAVKLLTYVGPPEGLQSFQERFQREAKMAAMLTHQNLVGCKDFGWEPGIGFYLVMELVDGQSLEDRLREVGPMGEAQALEMIAGAADGLALAHASSVIHRDIKPANLLIAAGDVVKIADLGLGREDGSDSMTRTGYILGTPAYMAPEQATDTKTVGPATDVYALGVTLFQMLTGELPFEGGTTMEIIYKHVNEPTPDPRDRGFDLAPSTIELLDRMLAKAPGDRLKDGAAAATAIRRALALVTGGEASVTTSSRRYVAAATDAGPISPEPTRRRSGLRTLMIIGLFVIFAALLRFLFPGTPQQGATDFLNLLRRDQVQVAYRETSWQLRKETDLEEFTEQIESAGLPKALPMKWELVSRGAKTADLRGVVQGPADAPQRTLSLQLSLEKRAWRVASFTIEERARELPRTGPPPTPPPDDEEELTRAELRRFWENIQQAPADGARSFFANLIAREWRDRSSSREIQERLEGFLRRGRRGRGTKSLGKPTFSQEPRSGGGFVAVVEYRMPRGNTAQIRMELVKENGRWKLAAFEPPRH